MRNIINVRNIERMTDVNFIRFMRTIHARMSENSVIREATRNGNFAMLDSLKDAVELFQEAFEAAFYKDVRMVDAKRKARAKAIDLIKKIANQVELLFWDETAKIAALGFPVKRQRTTHSAPLGATARFTVVQGKFSGQVIGKAQRIPGAPLYDVRVTEGNPAVEENYRHFDTFTGCSNMVLNGFTPTRKCSFCVRGRSSKSVGPWSTPVTIIIT